MGRGFTGTFVLSWDQTEIDGQRAAAPEALSAGMSWRWRGEALRLDGPSGLLSLERAEATRELHRNAARMMRRLAPSRAALPRRAPEDPDALLLDRGFLLTDGRHSYAATLIETAPDQPPLLMFLDSLPDPGREHWVVRSALAARRRPRPAPGGAGAGFAMGTRIATPEGARRIEDLCTGDLVLTRDAGPQRLRGVHLNRISGARLHLMPQLRPVRILPGAFGLLRPEEALLVSPDHLVLVSGGAARALFNASEVLVHARDLLNGGSVVQDFRVNEVTYVQLRLEGHQILTANGVGCESLHPAEAAQGVGGGTGQDAAPARRVLSQSEAAILQRNAA
ncbi:MAG: Hint domain-containing protein [Rhodobacteraceae bacterium]|nr:Hint domain-containing protein [Paracoccaceae bacterium]MBR9820404.1 Hint domain-containing protein [Paracoccaceae bacterium]